MKEGDIVWIEYDVYLGDSDELIETTSKDNAVEAEIVDDKKEYGPIPVELGKGQLIKGLDTALMEAKIGEENEVLIPPEDAYGVREAKNLALYPLPKLRRRGIEVEEGKEVEIDGKQGYIARVTGSRVRIDFNHPYAGKEIKYKFKITGKVDSDIDRIKAFIGMYYVNAESFEIDVKKELATIAIPDIAKYDQNWLLNKFRVTTGVFDSTDITKIVFTETWEKREPTEEEAAEGSEEGEAKEGADEAPKAEEPASEEPEAEAPAKEEEPPKEESAE